MNRTQAEHLLSAYLEMVGIRENEEAAEALKDVILDAMCHGGYITTVPYYLYQYPSWNRKFTWTSPTGTIVGDITAKPGTTGTIVGDITAKPGTTGTISGNGSL